MGMKDKLQPKGPAKTRPDGSSSSAVKFDFPAPQVKVSPQINVPTPTVNVDNEVDTAPIGQAMAGPMGALEAVLRQLADNQAKMLDTIAKQGEILERIANIEQKAPKVTMPARPSTYAVEVDRGDGKTVSMQIVGKKPH